MAKLKHLLVAIFLHYYYLMFFLQIYDDDSKVRLKVSYFKLCYFYKFNI